MTYEQDEFVVGLQAMQTATRRYARYQNKWVKTQLFERRNPEYVPPVYSFDSSHKEMNAETVIEPATRLLGKQASVGGVSIAGRFYI